LTPVELQILGMLMDGWPDGRVAAALAIPDRAVAGHVDNVLAKLAAPTRELAVRRAIRRGLYVPPVLGGIRE
jgi:DNA-binding NarL/FixJ family response regulator